MILLDVGYTTNHHLKTPRYIYKILTSGPYSLKKNDHNVMIPHEAMVSLYIFTAYKMICPICYNYDRENFQYDVIVFDGDMYMTSFV